MTRGVTQTMLLGLAALLTGSALAAENELGWTLDSALKQVDRQAEDFDTLLSDGTVVVRDGDGNVIRSMEGRIYISKKGEMRINVSKPAEKVLLVTSSEVQEYDPMEALVERYSLSKYKDRMEPYARLGFTNSGRDLTDDYLVTMLGEDKVGDRRALLLELTPKRDSERQIVAKITLWIDEASWMPLRQVIEHVTTSEQLTIDYVGMARNLNLNPDLFKSKWPKGTKQVRK
ncbi:MAG: outer membrane lipoprotein carrier protein LolA [Pseudomonadales bacterium]